MTVAGATAGPLLLAHEHWAVGAVATLLGVPAAAAAARSLHRLSRRWLVFVPGGMVIHDHIAVPQPMPIPRRDIISIGPAAADTAAADLTAQALGLALEIRLTAPVPVPAAPGRDRPAAEALITPTRPADVMATAARRGILIHRPSP